MRPWRSIDQQMKIHLQSDKDVLWWFEGIDEAGRPIWTELGTVEYVKMLKSLKALREKIKQDGT